MKLFDKILLLILKSRLKRYKRDAKWYHSQTKNIPNWYDEQGIPNLEKQIQELQSEINSKQK